MQFSIHRFIPSDKNKRRGELPKAKTPPLLVVR